MRPVPVGGSCEGGKVLSPWEPPSSAGRSAGTERELERPGLCSGGVCRFWLAGRQHREGPALRAAMLSHFLARDMCLLVCTVAGS